jgi:ATP-dependent exoDNAse (exonuclease V) beta subunit
VRYVDRMRAAAQHETEADVSDVSTGAVQVLSIHAAKGLEWPVVFVAQTSRRRRSHGERVVIDGQRRVVALPAGFTAPQEFQDLRRDAHAAEDDDQRRLLYVALTRARDLVVVSGPVDDGEGEWLPLSRALAKQAPTSVRVLAPNEQGEAIPVRAGGGVERGGPAPEEALAHAIDPPQIPRRRLVVEPAALEEFERCPRRYYALYEAGLPEHPEAAPGAIPADRAAVLAALRELLARIDVARLADAPEDAVLAAAAALEGATPAAALARATVLARAVAASPLGQALAQGEAVVACALPVALTVGEGDDAVALHGRVDLVLRGEVLGREGLVVVRYALATGGRDDAGEHMLGLEAWRLALARRFVDAHEPSPPLHAAVALVDEARARLVLLHPLRPGAFDERVLELGHRVARARAHAQWEGQDRVRCERLGCGFLARCHGG